MARLSDALVTRALRHHLRDRGRAGLARSKRVRRTLGATLRSRAGPAYPSSSLFGQLIVVEVAAWHPAALTTGGDRFPAGLGSLAGVLWVRRAIRSLRT